MPVTPYFRMIEKTYALHRKGLADCAGTGPADTERQPRSWLSGSGARGIGQARATAATA